jgi:hypothetical protein
MTIAKILLTLAVITLVATSALHGSGYASITKLLGESNLPGSLAVGMRGLWVDFSVQLIILAALLGVTVARPMPGARVVVLVCGLGLAVDTVVLGAIVGLFVGTVALALASVLTLAGWATYRGAGGDAGT